MSTPHTHASFAVPPDVELALLQASVEMHKEQLSELVARAERRVVEPGEILIKQGDEADAFYILVNGAVDVLLETPGHDPQLMAQLTSGMFFSGIGLLQGVQRTATVQVSEGGKAEVIEISRDVFTEFVAEFDLTDADIAHLLVNNNQGGLALRQGRLDAALGYYQRALRLLEQTGGSLWVFGALHLNMGSTICASGS